MLIILLGVGMGVLDGIVVSIALPTLTHDFGVPVEESSWVITGYLLTETSLLLIFGRVADFTGKGRLFFTGFFLFTVASLACGLSQSLMALILFRVVQAVGAAMFYSISAALIFEIYPLGEQGRAMGMIGATVAIAGIFAPMLGGFLTDAFGWESIFLINVPIGVGVLIIAARYMRDLAPPHREIPGGMDWGGAVTMVGAISAFFLLLGTVTGGGGQTSLLILIFLGCLGGFLFIERRHPCPLLDLSIFKNRMFTASCLAMVLLFVAFFMVNLIGPFYFELVLGLSPSQVGMVYFIAPIIMVIASPLTGWFYDRHPSPSFTVAGLVLCGLSLLLMGYSARMMSLPLIVVGFVPLAVGSALFQSPNNTEVMRALPREQTGMASSVSATIRNLGMTLGVTLASLLLSLVLASYGYNGPVMDADPLSLANAIGSVLIIGSLFCFAGAVVMVLRALSGRKT
jgi:EmrB/QacA subfamily drug resistance transporter